MTAGRVVPVTSLRPNPGLYAATLKHLGIRDGQWIRVRYSDRKIDRSVREVDREPGWQDALVFLSLEDRKKLKLPDLGGATPRNPPTGVQVTVESLRFPRDTALYLGVTTLALAVSSAAVSSADAVTPDASPLAPALIVLALFCTIATAVVGFAATLARAR